MGEGKGNGRRKGRWEKIRRWEKREGHGDMGEKTG
jgi:hypothetical protein